MTSPTGQNPNPEPDAANGAPFEPSRGEPPIEPQAASGGVPYTPVPESAGQPYPPQAASGGVPYTPVPESAGQPYAQQAASGGVPYTPVPESAGQPYPPQGPGGAPGTSPASQPVPYGQPQAPLGAAQPQSAQYQPAQQGAYGVPANPGYAPAPQRATTNPFKGIATSDIVTDSLAAVLFLISLALPWNARGTWSSEAQSRDLIEVLLIVLLSALAVGVPYLGRAGVFGKVWAAAQSRSIRLLLPVPYVLLVVIHVIIGGVTEPKTVVWGSSVMFGLAAAALLATPRRFELDAASAKTSAATWKLILFSGLGVAGVAILASSIWLIIDHADQFADKALLLALLAIVTLLVSTAIAFGAGVAALITGSPAWRRAFVAFGVVLLVFSFFGLDDESTLPRFEIVNPNPLGILLAPLTLNWGFGFFLIPAIAAILASPAFTITENDQKPGESSVRSAGVLLWIGAGISLLVILNSISILLIGNYDGLTSTAKLVTALVLALLTAGVTGYAGIRLWALAAESRLIGFVGIVTAFILGIVQLSIAPEYFDTRVITFGHLALAFGIPIAAILALVGNKAARSTLSSLAHSPAAAAPGYQQGYAVAPGYQVPPQQGAPQPQFQTPQPDASQPYHSAAPQPPIAPYQAPAVEPLSTSTPSPLTGSTPVTDDGASAPASPVAGQTAVSEPGPVSPVALYEPASAPASPSAGTTEEVAEPEPSVPTHAYTAAQASDPATDQQVLAEIVQHAPELRVNVAGNPSAYPALVDWLKLLGDPAIDAAIAKRND
ncbi:hypothetical protein GCM10010401_19730 [Rarobacter faecitabidus]|uniref:Uncharacterized protein n=1 Tax=Rarobacter faecitabidus TaxID=13243 RepID=A0A542ZUZ0_RARFA|nr:hypothetical protein [Rarobacter faecitabidus]TQL64178.1 hypothetical protein FB461_0669 [Rarobacter faecitabidus]